MTFIKRRILHIPGYSLASYPIRAIKFLLFFFIILTLVISPLQMQFNFIKETSLKGYVVQSETPKLTFFTWERWFSSTFQNEFSTRLNNNIGLRKSLIRLNNQFDYSFFGLIHAKGFLQGLDHYLFEEEYLHEYNGDYFIGKAVIDKKLRRLKNIQDSLNAHNIRLLLVYEPGKASFYPEYIPGRFHPGKRTQTNYDYFSQRSGELGLSCLDINRYFLLMKGTARYPLFPPYGMHWSLYGIPFAVDTLIKSVELVTGTTLPKFKIRKLIRSQTPYGTDNDIGELLNLMFPLRHTISAFPLVTFDNRPAKTLSALVIADSYYINIVENYGNKIFKYQDFWYYNSTIYPYQHSNPPLEIDKSNLREKLKKYDVILLMVSEINLHCGFWKFADEAYCAFHPKVKDDYIYKIENDIRNDRSWFSLLVKRSKGEKVPLESMIRLNAEYVFYCNYSGYPQKTFLDSINYIVYNIRNNPDWMKVVTKKAREWKVPVDSVLILDAIWTYDHSKQNP